MSFLPVDSSKNSALLSAIAKAMTRRLATNRSLLYNKNRQSLWSLFLPFILLSCDRVGSAVLRSAGTLGCIVEDSYDERTARAFPAGSDVVNECRSGTETLVLKNGLAHSTI